MITSNITSTRWKRERPTTRPLATTYRGTMTDEGDKDQALWVRMLEGDEECEETMKKAAKAAHPQ